MANAGFALRGRPVLDQRVTAKSDPDFSGLSFAYRFRDGLAEPIAGRDITAALAEPGGWIWIHLSLVDITARLWIEKTAPFPERAREILLSDGEHQLLEPIDAASPASSPICCANPPAGRANSAACISPSPIHLW
jgi:hypothetical protein